MVLLSIVTAASRARARPSITALLFSVMDCMARMVPLNWVVVPRVAELPTCQNTLQAFAPLMKATELDEAVVRVEGIRKMKTELGSPSPSRVTVPVSCRDGGDAGAV